MAYVFLIIISLLSIIIVCASNGLFFLFAFNEDKWNENKFGLVVKNQQGPFLFPDKFYLFFLEFLWFCLRQ